jgi:hypothetical protein
MKVAAVSSLALFAFVSLTSAGEPRFTKAQPETSWGKTFKAVFTLTANNATLTHDSLLLSGVHSQVFVVETDDNDAIGVTAPSVPFLERWQSIDHSIHPNAILFAEEHEHEDPYKALNFVIDDPRPNSDEDADNWKFDITHVTAQARDTFSSQSRRRQLSKSLSEGLAFGPVTLAVVMVHTQQEFDQGLVCGPWNLDSLKHHLEIIELD